MVQEGLDKQLLALRESRLRTALECLMNSVLMHGGLRESAKGVMFYLTLPSDCT